MRSMSRCRFAEIAVRNSSGLWKRREASVSARKSLMRAVRSS